MAVKFIHENTHYTVDLNPGEGTGLWRQNAMTTYEFVKPYMIVAKNLGNVFEVSNKPIFFLVFCKDHGWVQVPLEIGYKILKHPLVTKIRKKILIGSLVGVLALGISVIRRMKKKRE